MPPLAVVLSIVTRRVPTTARSPVARGKIVVSTVTIAAMWFVLTFSRVASQAGIVARTYVEGRKTVH